ncbi:hypothetical protein FGB62_303g04 [Gracilaria domingensis]|nr:hypothetical protein FGB62_303g04 [Gracilaria domingensis]
MCTTEGQFEIEIDTKLKTAAPEQQRNSGLSTSGTHLIESVTKLSSLKKLEYIGTFILTSGQRGLGGFYNVKMIATTMAIRLSLNRENTLPQTSSQQRLWPPLRTASLKVKYRGGPPPGRSKAASQASWIIGSFSKQTSRHPPMVGVSGRIRSAWLATPGQRHCTLRTVVGIPGTITWHFCGGGILLGLADGLAVGVVDGVADGEADGVVDGVADGVVDGVGLGMTSGVTTAGVTCGR